MKHLQYTIIAICFVVLLVFLPFMFADESADTKELDDIQAVMANVPSESLWADVPAPDNYDDEGKTGQAKDNVPVNVKYAAGISDTAQSINTEYWNLVKKHIDATYSTNKKATQLYILAAADIEQGRKVNDDQIFITGVVTQTDYDKNNNIIKEYWTNDKQGVVAEYTDDPDGVSGQLGAHSIYHKVMADPAGNSYNDMLSKIPNYSDIGTSFGHVSPPRTTTYNGVTANGHTSNWYDSSQVLVGYMEKYWGSCLPEIAAKKNDTYFYIGMCGLAANLGGAVMLGNPDYTTKVGGAGEYMSPKFGFEWVEILSQDWAISKIRDYVKRNQPVSLQAQDKVKEELASDILREAKARALAKDPNFFSSSRYTVDWTNPYVGGQEYGWQSWVGKDSTGANRYNSNKISTPIKLIIQSIILEARYSGEY